jgi:hypothetical protein
MHGADQTGIFEFFRHSDEVAGVNLNKSLAETAQRLKEIQPVSGEVRLARGISLKLLSYFISYQKLSIQEN